MADRPAIPTAIQRQVLFEARHRCAVCCEPTPLEKAHIISWNKSHDHSAANLIALCANCHERADNEKWGEDMLRRYKQTPCALASNAPPPMTARQKAMVDLIADRDPAQMDDHEKVTLASILAACLNVQYSEIRVVSVAAANSARIRLEMPRDAVERFVAAFDAEDPRLDAFLAEIGVPTQSAATAAVARSPLMYVDPVTVAAPVTAGHTDTTEKGLETLIFESMLALGWTPGTNDDYLREYAVNVTQLRAFIEATQPKVAEAIPLDSDSPVGRAFLDRLRGEIEKRGVIDVLRHGISHGKHASIDLFYGTPSAGNPKAAELHAANVFTVTRQLRYSTSEAQRALDLCIFINGLPIATFELKNSLTKQTVEDAVEQYKRDRDPRELLFHFGRCIVHLAVDDHEVRMCTKLAGKGSWFLPLNRGWNDGAGNPPNPYGLKTDYLWKRTLTPAGLTDLIENYAQIVTVKNPKTGRKKHTQIFPRYHQRDVVRKLLAHAAWHGVGHRYLVQHSAGSGKSNSIAWLAHQLIGLRAQGREVFDSIVVVTDRLILDHQIKNTIKQFAQVGSVVAHAENAGDLRKFIEDGKKIIITTIQKFPFVLDEIGDQHRHSRFAIVIDEAHSSQGGRVTHKMHMALEERVPYGNSIEQERQAGKDGKAALDSHVAKDGGVEYETGTDADAEEDFEDKVNKLIESRKMLKNASYFAFTATPKNKTLELFGEPDPAGEKTKHRPFHSYTMKQAIQEGFIIDVLKTYTPVDSYYRLIKTIETDPEFDTKRARKKLRRYVETHDHAVGLKAEIIVDHFHEQVVALNKIAGLARAMVVTSSIQQALQYYHAIRDYLAERHSPYKAIVAFSGEPEYGGAKVTEASLNGFPSSHIADKIQEDPYRILVCADKFQTGYDEPLLHTMYVDKVLSGIRAVQALSRLNRADPRKHDAFVLDFMNDAETIKSAFADYYRTTILSEETDPNKLHDLRGVLDRYQVYTPAQVEALVRLYIDGADRDKLDPILDACVATYKEQLDEDGQVDFKGKGKAFCRTYEFLASILPYGNPDWEKLSIFMNFLVPKLPAPKEEDLSKGILEAIDMDSYRAEKRASMRIELPDQDAEIPPVPTDGGGRKPEPALDLLSNILKVFNDLFGNISWSDRDRVHRLITQEIPERVNADRAYSNAKRQPDRQNARIEHDKALGRVLIALMKDDTELFRQFSNNPDFKRWLTDTIFQLTYDVPEEDAE